MLANLLNPFHTLAVWLVSLLPAGSGEMATGLAVALGLLLGLFALLLPVIAIALAMEYADRRCP